MVSFPWSSFYPKAQEPERAGGGKGTEDTGLHIPLWDSFLCSQSQEVALASTQPLTDCHLGMPTPVRLRSSRQPGALLSEPAHQVGPRDDESKGKSPHLQEGFPDIPFPFSSNSLHKLQDPALEAPPQWGPLSPVSSSLHTLPF